MGQRRELLIERARTSVPARTSDQLASDLRGTLQPIVIDVREAAEVETGRLPGAIHVPRGLLELRIESIAPLEVPVVLYCASGVRSLLAARSLLEMGYLDVSSLEGGIDAWKASGRSVEVPPCLSSEERRRYARHLTLPEVGEQGQLRLRSAKVLIIGAGGLGSPASLYLAAAGVGKIGLMDDDLVDVSNLQRQIIHHTKDAGVSKVESAQRKLTDLNPSVEVETFSARFEPTIAPSVLRRGWDVVIDATDVIAARYQIGDACRDAQIPLIHGAIHRFEGQVSVFAPHLGGPCYRCLFPVPPGTDAVPSCAEAGVLGVLPGVIGVLQAAEALKLVLGIGKPLIGRLLRYDALTAQFEELTFARDPRCCV